MSLSSAQRKRLSLTRIYEVSTSMIWNIPKQLQEFRFQIGPQGYGPTVKEGLPQVAHIQFRDRAVDVFHELEAWLTKYPYRRIAAPHFVHSGVVGTYKITKFLTFSHDEDQFQTLRRSLRTRATSWQYDEPICLAIVLALDMNEIVQAPDQEKMRIFWQLMGNVPGMLAFSRPSRKLTQRGFHWAPASLIGDFGWEFNPSLKFLPEARPCDDGLVVSLQACRFQACSISCLASRLKKNFTACFQPWDEHFRLSLLFNGLQDSHGNWYVCQIGKKWNQENDTWTSMHQQPVILLSQPLRKSTLTDESNPGTEMNIQRALFASYHPSQTTHDHIRLTVHNHFNVKACTKVENQWRDELRRCVDALLGQHDSEIESMRDDVHDLSGALTKL